MKKIALILSVVLLSALCFIALFGCGNNDTNDNDGLEVTDLLGRSVTVPKEIDRVVCIGAGALRLYTYVGDMSKLSGVEDVDRDGTGIGGTLSIRPYKMVNKNLFNSLPSCGMGGPTGAADAEKILSCAPDIVFSLYTSDKAAMDTLQKQIGIPVVVFSYGTTEAFDNAVIESLRLIGKIMGREERANDLIEYIGGIVDELSALTKDVPESEKPSVYLGCQSNYGTHGIESSSADYSIFEASNIKNVLDINGYKGYQRQVDLEALLTMNPDKIILDAGGLSILQAQYADETKAAVFNKLKAFKEGEVYLQMPYNAYFTNLEIAYCDAYFDAWVSYPDIMSDFDYVEKSREIIVKFLGVDCYNEIAETMYGGFQKLDLEKIFDNYGS